MIKMISALIRLVTCRPPETQYQQPNNEAYPGSYNYHHNVHDNNSIVHTPAEMYVDDGNIAMNTSADPTADPFDDDEDHIYGNV